MPEISIVLAAETMKMLATVLERLGSLGMNERLEVVVVLPSAQSHSVEDYRGLPLVQVVNVGSLYPLATARARGVRASNAPIVFIGETHSFPRPGMFEALVDAHADNWDVVVPIFENENPSNLVSWAGFLNGYASWTEGRAAEEMNYAPNFNVSYRASFLKGLGNELAYALSAGDDMVGRLRAAGQRVQPEPRARIGHANITDPHHWLTQRVSAGRVIASTRSKRWSRARRLMFALAAPLIPIVLLIRHRVGIARTIERNKVSPAVVLLLGLGMSMQAAGELAGYLMGPSVAAQRCYDEYEVRQLSFAVLSA